MNNGLNLYIMLVWVVRITWIPAQGSESHQPEILKYLVLIEMELD